MKIRYQIFTFLLGGLLLLPDLAFGTAQTPEYLILNGDTLAMHSTPLQSYLHENPEAREALKSKLGGCSSTACGRDYIGYWTLRNDSLFLVDLRHCCYEDVSARNLFPQLFNRETAVAPVFAKWFSGEIVIPEGKLLQYVDMGFLAGHERERILYFEKGVLTEEQEFENPKVSSKYVHKDTLQNFLSSNFDWAKIDKEVNKIAASASFRVDTLGQIDSVRIWRCIPDSQEQEMIQIIQAIPNWAVYYRRGKAGPEWWSLTFTVRRDDTSTSP